MPKRVRVSSQPQRDQHQRPDGDQEQVVRRHRAAEDVDGAGEARRARSEQVLGAPDRERRVAHDQHDAERRRELQQLGRRVEPLQQQRLDQRADRGDRERRQQRRRPRSRSGAAAERARRVDHARYAPSMYSEPCAKLTTRVTPKISVSPAATRNSAEAPARPLSSWRSERGDGQASMRGAGGRTRLAERGSAARRSVRRPQRASRRRRRAGSPCRRRSASRPSRPCRP